MLQSTLRHVLSLLFRTDQLNPLTRALRLRDVLVHSAFGGYIQACYRHFALR